MHDFMVQVRNVATGKLVYSKGFDYLDTALAAAESSRSLADSYRLDGRGEYRVTVAITL